VKCGGKQENERTITFLLSLHLPTVRAHPCAGNELPINPLVKPLQFTQQHRETPTETHGGGRCWYHSRNRQPVNGSRSRAQSRWITWVRIPPSHISRHFFYLLENKPIKAPTAPEPIAIMPSLGFCPIAISRMLPITTIMTISTNPSNNQR
jgi:hypothetical protein